MNPAEHLALNVSGACFGESQRVTEFSLKEHTQCLTHSKTKSRSGHSKEELNIQKMKIMASGPIISWEIDGETVETVSDFIFLGSKITADGDCSHEIKTLTPWKASYDQPR